MDAALNFKRVLRNRRTAGWLWRMGGQGEEEEETRMKQALLFIDLVCCQAGFGSHQERSGWTPNALDSVRSRDSGQEPSQAQGTEGGYERSPAWTTTATRG